MTLTRVLLKTCAAGALAMSLAGCSYLAKAILAPQKDISRFYLITPTADTGAAAQAAAQSTSGAFTIGLGPIKLPPYLDRPEIVTRMAPNRLELSKEDRWGESIQNGFTRAMERDLAAQAGTGQVIVFPWYNTVHIDMQVQIDVYRFETDGQGTATLSAKWTILDSTGRNILYTVESNLTQPSKPGDMTDAAAALSRTIGDLSGQIANMLHQLRSQQGAHPA
ncbi:MAG TPA: PqiC family protein [Candidatus Binatus sp.]|uniref:PqiC family protein n=1 Tax=Candidatus Binatus sp. TaxID=2811406 RepID=UPI002B4AA432|nr:PqiC family protein [Candidatus Binatus sp.]HKN14327.1 PqiC family protein [Candidatus Binatus sp.]